MTKYNPRCVYCNNHKPSCFTQKVHVLSQFMGNFQPDIYFQRDVVCDECNNKLGNSIEKHFAEKNFEGLIARLHLRRKKEKQSAVILYDAHLLKFYFPQDLSIAYDPLFLLVKSAIDKIKLIKDPILLLKKDNLYAFIFAEEVSRVKSQNEIRNLQCKLEPFKKGVGSGEWVGDRDDSGKIVQSALVKLGLKANFSDEKINAQLKQIKSEFLAQQVIDKDAARFVAKIAFEYFVYCANKSGVFSNVFTEELKPIRNFIRKGNGDDKNFVSVADTSFISQTIKLENNHYFLAFEVINGFLIGRVAFMDTIGYTVFLGRSPFSFANNKIGNAHAFNLINKIVQKMYNIRSPILNSNEFSIYSKR